MLANYEKQPQDPVPGGDLEKAGRTSTSASKDDEFPDMTKAVVIMISVYLAMFIVALDRTILGTAIPKITDDFHSIDDVGWYASAYLLTSCAFQLIYGRIYTFYSPKWVLLGSVGLFEVGVRRGLLYPSTPNHTLTINISQLFVLRH